MPQRAAFIPHRDRLRMRASGRMQAAAESSAAGDGSLLPLEIGSQAVWSLSSSKPGFGVAQLRDDSTGTYWQSDGQQPHYVNVQFLKKTLVETISLYFDYKQDESYTPSKVAIRAGSTFNDLIQITVVEFTEPEGWVDIKLLDKNERPVKAFHFQVVILANHQNGRDAHIRQIKIFEPSSGNKLEQPLLQAFESTDYVQTLR